MIPIVHTGRCPYVVHPLEILLRAAASIILNITVLQCSASLLCRLIDQQRREIHLILDSALPTLVTGTDYTKVYSDRTFSVTCFKPVSIVNCAATFKRRLQWHYKIRFRLIS